MRWNKRLHTHDNEGKKRTSRSRNFHGTPAIAENARAYDSANNNKLQKRRLGRNTQMNE